MRARKVNEAIDFERGTDPNRSLKIGSGRFIIPPSAINFERREGQGFRGDNITVIAPGWTSKAGRKVISIEDRVVEDILPDIVEFLNTPEIKLKVSQILQGIWEERPDWFKIK